MPEAEEEVHEPDAEEEDENVPAEIDEAALP